MALVGDIVYGCMCFLSFKHCVRRLAPHEISYSATRRHHDRQKACMDNVGMSGREDIDAAIEFFTPSLASTSRGAPPIEGDWADGVTGLRDMRVEIAMMPHAGWSQPARVVAIPSPPVVADHRNGPSERSAGLPTCHVHRGGHRRYACPARQTRRAEVVGEVVQYENSYRLCYISEAPKEFSSGSPKSSGSRLS